MQCTDAHVTLRCLRLTDNRDNAGPVQSSRPKGQPHTVCVAVPSSPKRSEQSTGHNNRQFAKLRIFAPTDTLGKQY